MTPAVSIVIVTWNGRQHLDRCLAAVAAQEGVEAETILVDNASSDGSVEHVAAAYPWVRIVRLPLGAGELLLVYGGFAGLVATLVFLYLSAVTLILGAEFNAVLRVERGDDRDDDRGPG